MEFLKKYNLKKVVTIFFLVSVALFLLILAIVPVSYEKLEPKQAYRFYDENDQIIAMLISEDDFFRMHIPIEKISPLFIETLLLKEDQYFYNHFGVNPFSIFRAAFMNVKSGRIVSGGSTITMQLARMLERRDRTFISKITEAFCALKIELKYSKKEILASYLALAPYGGNIEGIQAASFLYFGKPATDLSIGEIALLVGIPKSPTKYRPDRHPEKAREVRDNILELMFSNNLITEKQLKRSNKESVNIKRKKVVNIIPHLAWNKRLKTPGKYVYKTTINQNLQLRTNRLLKSYVNTLIEHNISNGAAVVIDNKTGNIKAIVGSLDYFSVKGLGANDGSMSKRSPGSTLKPFLYGLAFQAGLMSEKKVLYDIPVNYAGYSPRNYNREFLGLVRVDEALTESLNVVAVRMSKELGYKQLYNLLKKGGITSLDKPKDFYGLPLILGGVEMRLTELTNLYSALANKGVYTPYHILKDEIEEEPVKILSEDGAWLTTRVLKDVERPDFPENWMFAKDRPDIAFKTGTSYGQQDAWSIGYTPEYSIGVWVGNFDGSTSRGLSGRRTAAPILFDLFQAIMPTITEKWDEKPSGVNQRQVCELTGKLPSQHCKKLLSEYYVKGTKGKIESERCKIHQEICIDTRTGKQAGQNIPVKFRKKKIFEIWPSEIATFLLKHGVPVRNVPGYDYSNMTGQIYYPPKILSPVKNTIYYKRYDKLDPEEHGIKLSAAITNRSRKGFWFLNGELISETDLSKDIIINPGPGNYTIKLVDDTGGSAKVKLSIKDSRELTTIKPEINSNNDNI